nr:acyltransferase [Nocardioides soli]
MDALRGLAAFAVVMGHTRAQILVAQGHPKQGEGWQKLALAPTGFAAEAVALFFVVSGFLVGGQVVRNVRANRFTWRTYAIRRLSRLYVVLVPTILFTLVVDWWTRGLFEPNAASAEADETPTAREVVCNLAFLQDARCDPIGSNGSLWSLSYEFWFYVVFAAGVLALAQARSRSVIRVGINVVIVFGVIALFGWHLLWLIPAWLLGVALAMWHDVRRVTQDPVAPRSVGVAALGLAIVCAATSVSSISDEIRFLVVGVASLPLVSYATRPSAAWQRRWVSRWAWVGAWSYTLYAFHRPIVAFVATAIGAKTEFSASVEVVVVYVASGLIAAACYPAFFLGEAHTGRIRNWLLFVSDRGSRTDVEPRDLQSS